MCTHEHSCTQTWKKLIFVRKPIFQVKKCPQIHIFPNHIKLPKLQFLPVHFISLNKNRLIVDWYWRLVDINGQKLRKIVVYPKMSTIFSKIVCKQRLHACNFFHVCLHQYVALREVSNFSSLCHTQLAWEMV